MTFSFVHLQTAENTFADITQNKGSNLFRVSIYSMHGNIPIIEYIHDYRTIGSAKQAIKRHCQHQEQGETNHD